METNTIQTQVKISGKREFCDFIIWINTHKLTISQDIVDTLKKLISLWKGMTMTNDLVYMENIQDYEIITDFVRYADYDELLKLWFSHVMSITIPNFAVKTKQQLELNVAHYEFKIKCTEKWEQLYDSEIEMLNFYRKAAVVGMLVRGSDYIKKPLVDKLLLNCNEMPYEKIHNGHIEVRSSSIHGNGVFATDNIEEGTIITFYPINGYKSYDESDEDYGIAKLEENFESDNKTNLEDYSCVINDKLVIIANPKKIDNKSLLGHMINDSVGNTFSGSTTHDIKNGIYEYYFKSNNNCKIKINEKYGIVYVITTTNIEKDTELLASYSPAYWFNRIDSNMKHFYDVCSEGKISEFLKNNVFEVDND